MLPGARTEKGINLIQPVSPVAELIRLLPVVVSPLPRAATGAKTHFLSEYDEGVTNTEIG